MAAVKRDGRLKRSQSLRGAEGSVARSDTVPEAEVKDNISIRKQIYYVVNVFSNSGYIAYCGIGLFPHCG